MNFLSMWKRAFIGAFLCVTFLLWPVACGPAKEGEYCKANEDCVTGLFCRSNRCTKRTILPPEDGGDTPEEPSTQDQEPSDDTPQDQPSEVTPDQTPGDDPPKETQPEPRTEPRTEPSQENVTPDNNPTETTPETPQDNSTPSELTIYDILDPASGKNPKEGTEVTIKEAIVTTPSVRLSATLNMFFVQASKERNGSYKYGGMMVVYNRTTYPNVNFTLGTIVELKGKFVVFSSIDWSVTCLLDTDCTKADFPKCKEVFNTRTNMNEKHCVSGVGMPQLELTTAPVSRGNAPVPTPVVVKPADIRAAPNATPYLGVLLELQNVVVTNANPDAPRDYSEFSVADPSDKTNDVRVDDQINTIVYTGSKYCNGCSGSPKKPDDSYCLPGDTCQCSGSDGRCHSGTPRADMRKLNDTWQKIIGVLRYANDNFKLLPRLPTDMQ